MFSNIALSSALTAATASTKHFGVRGIKYFAVMCINAAVTGVTNSNCNKFSSYMHSVPRRRAVVKVDELVLTSPITFGVCG